MVSWDISEVMGVALCGVGVGVISWSALDAALFRLVAVTWISVVLVCKVRKSWCSVSRTALAVSVLSRSIRSGFGGEGVRVCLEM